MCIEITKIEEQEKFTIYSTIIEKTFKNRCPVLLNFETCYEKDQSFLIQPMSIIDKETFDVYIKSLKKTYAHILEEQGVYNTTMQGEYVFGIDERKNIIFGEVLDYIEYSNKVVVKLLKFNKLNNNVENIIHTDTKYLINVKDKKTLLKLKEDRLAELNLKLFFNGISERIIDIQDDLLNLCDELHSLNQKINNFNATQKSHKKNNRYKKYLIKKIQNLKDEYIKLNSEKKEILEDVNFNEFIEYVLQL